VRALDVIAAHHTASGHPLLSAAQLELARIARARTVYEWRRRGWLAPRGLDERGTELWDVTEVCAVQAAPGKRRPVAA
jgi:hypothetical protein